MKAYLSTEANRAPFTIDKGDIYLAMREARAILAETEPTGTEHINLRMLTVRGTILAESLAAFVEE